MEIKEIMEKAMSGAEKRYPCSDVDTALRNVLEAAGTVSGRASDSVYAEYPAAPAQTKRHRILTAAAGTAGAAAVIAGAFFGLRFLSEHGGLKEGGPDMTDAAFSGTSGDFFGEPVSKPEDTESNDTAADASLTDIVTDDTTFSGTSEDFFGEPVSEPEDTENNDTAADASLTDIVTDDTTVPAENATPDDIPYLPAAADETNSFGIHMKVTEASGGLITVMIERRNLVTDEHRGDIAYNSGFTIRRYDGSADEEPLITHEPGEDIYRTELSGWAYETADISCEMPLEPGRYVIEKMFYDISHDGSEIYAEVPCAASFEIAAPAVDIGREVVRATVPVSTLCLRDTMQTGLISMAGYCTSDGTGYGIADSIIVNNKQNLAAVVSERAKENPAYGELPEAIAPYCDDNGDLLPEKLAELPRLNIYHPLDSTPAADEYYSNHIIGDKWLISYYKTAKTTIIYLRDDTITTFRHILETLWEGVSNYPDIAAVMTDDDRGGSRTSYLNIVGNEEDLENARYYLEKYGIDLSLCRFTTKEELRGSWLPVTQSWVDESGAEGTPFDSRDYKFFSSIDDLDRYSFYGVYNAVAETDDLSAAAEMMRRYGIGEENARLAESGDFDSFIEIRPSLSDIFDICPIITAEENAGVRYYGIQLCLTEDEFPGRLTDAGVILSVEEPADGAEPVRYRVWMQERGETVTAAVSAVQFWRRYPEVSDDDEDIHFSIDSIEAVFGSGAQDSFVRVYADKACWDDLKRFNEGRTGLISAVTQYAEPIQ